ncbi:MAG: metallophosphoesterase [Acidobacteriota bacterium]
MTRLARLRGDSWRHASLLLVLVVAVIGALGWRRGWIWIRGIYDIVTLILPGGLGLIALRALLSRRRGLAGGNFALATALGLLRVWSSHVELEWLAVRRAAIETPKVGRTVRILHLSDVQAMHVGGHEARVFGKVRDLHPDLLLYTGDLVQTRTRAEFPDELSRMAPLLASVEPPLGKIAVFGDTDRALRGTSLRERGGLELLEGACYVPLPGGGRIALLGLTLRESRADVRALVRAWLSTLGRCDVGIVLGHAPDYAMALVDEPVDLLLAGHTHGGQVRIPFLGPPHIASGVPRAWSRGFRSIGRPYLNVSAGAGAEHAFGLPCIRFNCPTEMTLLELRPAEQ